MHLTRSVTALLACAALSAGVLAQSKAFKNALPANSLFLFSAPDLATSITEFKSTALFQMWREEEVQEFLGDALKMGQKEFEKVLKQGRAAHKAGRFPFNPDDLLKLRVQSVSFAATSLDIKMGAGKPDPRIGLMAHLDFGDSADQWQKVINFGLRALVAQARGEVEKSESEVAGVKIHTFSNPKSSMSLNVAFVNKGVVVGTLKKEVSEVISNMVAGKSVLTASSNYKETAKRLDLQGAEAEFYFQPNVLVDALMTVLKMASEEAPNFPQELDIEGIDRAITALGLRSYKAIGLTSQYQGKKSVTRSFSYSPEPQRKGFVASSSRDLKMDFLKWVPKDAANLSAETFNPLAVYNGLMDALKAYDKDTAEQLLKMMKMYEEQLGMTLKEDLFGTLGDHVIWWSMGISSLMQAPEWAILMQVKDEKRLLKSIEALAEMSGGRVELVASERRGVKTYRLEVNPEMVDEAMAMALANLQPCFSFKKGYMVMALSTGDVRRAMKRMNREDEPKGDIRSNESFAEYLAMLPKSRVNAISWTDWKSSFESWYQAITSILAFAVPGDEVPIDLTLLPEAETLSKHLFGSMTWSVADGTGFRSTTISPVGPELIVAGIVVGVGSLATFGVVGRAAAAPRVIELEAEEVKPKKKKKKEGETKQKKVGGSKEPALSGKR